MNKEHDIFDMAMIGRIHYILWKLNVIEAEDGGSNLAMTILGMQIEETLKGTVGELSRGLEWDLFGNFK